MTKYQIPETYLKGFETIATLSTASAKKIAQVLSDIPVGYNEEKLAILLRDKSELDEWDSFNIASVLFSLIALKLSRTDGASDNFVIELAQAYIEQSKVDNGKEVANKLNENLNILLSADGNLRLTHKARYLQSEYAKVFLQGRIISDIRLVYENEIEKVAAHSLIVHQLKIHYQENGEHKNLFFALDNSDLKKLKEVIIRAEQKDAQIRNSTYTKGLQFIDFNEEIKNGK